MSKDFGCINFRTSFSNIYTFVTAYAIILVAFNFSMKILWGHVTMGVKTWSLSLSNPITFFVYLKGNKLLFLTFIAL